MSLGCFVHVLSVSVDYPVEFDTTALDGFFTLFFFLNKPLSRFLAECANLKVPHRREKHVEYLFQHHQEETKSLNIRKETLSALEVSLSDNFYL